MSDFKTEAIIEEMLRENTGRALMDSGDHYGRHWERNAQSSFKDEPVAHIRWGTGGPEYAAHLYHYLVDRLDYDEAMTDSFREFAVRSGNDYHREDVEDWVEHLGFELGPGGNSYNHDNNLDQDIQWWEINQGLGDNIIALQIHGGCDIRGGYTAPRVFTEINGSLGGDMQGGSIICPKCRFRAYLDGWEWFDGSEGVKLSFEEIEDDEEISEILLTMDKGDEQLQEYIKIAPCEEASERQADLWFQQRVKYNDEIAGIVRKRNRVLPTTIFFQHKTNTGFCPQCGSMLEAGSL